MLFSVSTVRRAAVVLAVGCATALTATAASAAPATPAHSAAYGHPDLRPGQPEFSRQPGQRRRGQFHLPAEVHQHLPPHLLPVGFPGVAAVNRHGRQLGSPAAWVPGAPLRVVTLRRGWSGLAVLRITRDASSRTGCAAGDGPWSAGHPAEPGRAGFARLRFLASIPCGHRLPAGPADPPAL